MHRTSCYFPDHFLNNLCWYLLGVQGQCKEESWKSPIIIIALMGPNSHEGICDQHHRDPYHEYILEIIKDNIILKGIYFGQVAVKEFLNVGCIDFLTIVAPMNKVISCSNSRLQLFIFSSAVQGELLGNFLFYILFLDKHLIIFDFHGSR